MAIRVAILAGYDEGPFYFAIPGEGHGNRTIDEAARYLGLPADLVADLTAWDDEFQATLNLADLDDCGFPAPEAERAWIDSGKALAARVARDSPMVDHVDYQAHGIYDRGTCVFR